MSHTRLKTTASQGLLTCYSRELRPRSNSPTSCLVYTRQAVGGPKLHRVTQHLFKRACRVSDTGPTKVLHPTALAWQPQYLNYLFRRLAGPATNTLQSHSNRDCWLSDLQRVGLFERGLPPEAPSVSSVKWTRAQLLSLIVSSIADIIVRLFVFRWLIALPYSEGRVLCVQKKMLPHS